MPTIDERFLSVHPRTALWWEQREVCQRCKHVRQTEQTPKAGGEMFCAVVAGGGGNGRHPCITARDENQACGPTAWLFEPAR